MSDFWNPNNRTWQYYLNDVRMYQTSLFANCLICATTAPTVAATAVTATPDAVTVTAGEDVYVDAITTPANSTATVTVATSADSYATATISGRKVKIHGVAEGSATITVTATNADTTTVTDTISVTVSAATSA